MKASSGSTPINRTDPPLLTALGGPQCDVLFELVTGGTSHVYLGRMLTGTDAGRVVALRKLRGPASSELRAATQRVQGIAHPQLAKALGLLRIDGIFYVASEYIPGVTLFEVLRASLQRGQSLSAPFAVRVVLDALRAGEAAANLLGAGGEPALRCLYPESIWIAEFGETLLSEVLVSECLARAQGPSSASLDDVASAGSLLLSLISGVNDESSLDAPEMPESVAAIAARALGLRGAQRFTSVAEFADALSGLDRGSIASEAEVSTELASLMGAVLDIRRQKLAMTEREAVQGHTEDETKFFRAASATGGSTGLDTARPPPGPAAPSMSPPSSKQSRPPPSDDADEPTMLYRRPELEVVLSAPPPAEVPLLAPSEAASGAAAPVSPTAPISLAPNPVASFIPAPRAPSRRAAAFLVLVLALAAFGATAGPGGTSGYAITTHTTWVWLNGVGTRVVRWFR